MSEQQIHKLDNEHPSSADNDRFLKETPAIDPPSALATLRKLDTTEGKGLFTSAGENFNNAIFGRDSLIASGELLGWDPRIAHEVILTLATLQGTRNRQKSDEEPGRIHHENRNFKTWEASPLKKAAFEAMSYLWGGNFKEMTTYFSIDATPRFILLIADYAKEHPDILGEKVTRGDGQEITVEQSMVDATEWIAGHVAESGLVEVGRHNRIGLIHQTWKDSPTGYIQENGKIANVVEPIAYLNVQTIAADSLSAAAGLVFEDRQDQAEHWQTKAETIIQNTVKKFWIEDKQFFAAAIDKDNLGDERQLQVLQSDAGWMLNSNFFDNLPESDRAKYVSAVVKELFSEDFLTDVGIRSRALQYADKLNLADYHGSLVSWPIDTYMIAQGLRKQGLPKLAQQLESRILNAVNMSGDYYEFFYVQPDGKVLLDPEGAKKDRTNAENLPIQMYPESDIAWTVAAVFMIKLRNGRGTSKDESPIISDWATQLESDVLTNIKNVQAVRTIDELSSKYPEQPNIFLDLKEGGKRTAKMIGAQLLAQYLKR